MLCQLFPVVRPSTAINSKAEIIWDTSIVQSILTMSEDLKLKFGLQCPTAMPQRQQTQHALQKKRYQHLEN